jgi:hypothetical protein
MPEQIQEAKILGENADTIDLEIVFAKHQSASVQRTCRGALLAGLKDDHPQN